MGNQNFRLSDTIAAIATPLGVGGLSIVRLSGGEALKVADKLFVSADKKKPSRFQTHTVHYGRVLYPPSKSRGGREEIDEALMTVMRSPKSYTREDVVEISCHGGLVPARKILDLVLGLKVRLAEPGEFTKRAFLNGRIDLTQAEAVLDVIQAKTEAGLRVALNHLKGRLSKKIKAMREELIDLLSDAEASIDFSGEDIEVISGSSLSKRLRKNALVLKRLLDTAGRGIILTEGASVVICGKANVGKSSLMNALLKVEKVIVTPQAGTTRDTIEELINIEGVPVRIIDTAGVLEPADIVEEESILRSKNTVSGADIALFVLDYSRPLSAQDKEIIDHIKDKVVIVVVNKIDLPLKLKTEAIKGFLKGKEVVKISAAEGLNLRKVEKAIIRTLFQGQGACVSGPMLNNLRHKSLIRQAYDNLLNAEKSLKKGLSFEFIALDLKEALDRLGEITGESASGDILDAVFSKFCVGK
ncbi:MAG: tRNA uridine-5-carboxymethylaminomethyl(34) synthesis GTPase MnmE [Candidatus Omnitrophica bacterium]|nr:tRNA uridine-5-carboxymethylaminomethyl(34) synthesis GTPase MnmE [Candidatus Omnitrophota bacterium]